MYVIDSKTKEALPAKEISGTQAKHLGSGLAEKILGMLAQKPMYPAEIAKELDVHEQKIYYHVRNLLSSGMIKVEKEEIVAGALARFYSISSPAFFVRYSEMRPAPRVVQEKGKESDFLEPFIKNGRLDAKIIVGSPDPHGPEMSRSRDGYFAVDLALFLGSFLDSGDKPAVLLDTEVSTSDLKGNLILVGGPIVNTITSEVNSSLPVHFDPRAKWNVVSGPSGKQYPDEEAGIVVKVPNPYNRVKRLLVVAGKRKAGTAAAVRAFVSRFDKIREGNAKDQIVSAHVVRGLDKDSDGRIDDAEILE